MGSHLDFGDARRYVGSSAVTLTEGPTAASHSVNRRCALEHHEGRLEEN